MKLELQTLTENVIRQLQVMLEQQRREILANGKTLRVDYNVNKDDLLDEVDTASHDVEQGMSHAYDLGVEWERARVEKILRACKVDEAVVRDVLNGVMYCDS